MGHTMSMTTSSMKLAGLVLLGLLPHLAFALNPDGLKKDDIIKYTGENNKYYGEAGELWKVTNPEYYSERLKVYVELRRVEDTSVRHAIMRRCTNGSAFALWKKFIIFKKAEQDGERRRLAGWKPSHDIPRRRY